MALLLTGSVKLGTRVRDKEVKDITEFGTLSSGGRGMTGDNLV